MTGQYVYPIYSRLYVLGVNYTDVINWFGRILITMGAVDITLNVVSMILDAVLPESKSRNILVISREKHYINTKDEFLRDTVNKNILIRCLAYQLRGYDHICRTSKSNHQAKVR